jgi:hypothetical protein
MSRIKVKLADNIARVVFLESEATKGATLSTNLYLPSGAVATPATLLAYLGITDGVTVSGGSGAGTTNHAALANLTVGDPHTQYVRKATLTANGDLLTRAAGVPAPLPPGTDDQVLTMVSGAPAWADAGAGSGDVVGPATSTDLALARWDGATGALLQDSATTLDDTDNLVGLRTATLYPDGTTAYGFALKGRQIASLAVPYFRPLTGTNTPIALDIMPKGAPSNFSANTGVAWFDICSTDIEADGTNYECLRQGIFTGGDAHIGHAKGGTGTVRNLRLQMNGGNVHIGDGSSPSWKLEVNGASTPALAILDTDVDKFFFAQATGANNWFTGAADGDHCIRGVGGNILLGSNASTPVPTVTISAGTPGDVTLGGTLTVTGGIVGLNELIDDRVAALLLEGTNVTLTYDDGLGTLTIDAAGGGGGGAEYLTNLLDVEIYSPADGDVLTYDEASGMWIPAAPTGGSGGSGAINDGAFVSRTGTFSMANGYDAFEFDTEVRDDGGYFNSGVSASQFTISRAGWYAMTGSFSWAANTTGSRRIHIVKNGDTTNGLLAGQFEQPVTGVTLNQQVSAIAYLAAGEYVELMGNQSSGGALNASVGSFAIHRMTGVGGSEASDPRYDHEYFDDFIGAIASNGDWQPTLGGTGTITSPATVNHPGVIRCNRGTTAGNSAQVFLGVPSSATTKYILDTIDLDVEWLMRIETVADGTNDFEVACGLRDQSGGTQRAMAVASRASGALKWELRTQNGGATTTGVAVSAAPTAGTWHLVKLVASSTRVALYVDNVLIVTNTTQLPTTGMTLFCGMFGVAGSTTRTADFDFVRVRQSYPSGRY